MTAAHKTYRVYCYDNAHQIVTADWIEASSDEEAIAKAQGADFGSKCEVWDGRRLVAALSEERRTA